MNGKSTLNYTPFNMGISAECSYLFVTQSAELKMAFNFQEVGVDV